jgi:thiol-disulfide isomerase/thioredoxin
MKPVLTTGLIALLCLSSCQWERTKSSSSASENVLSADTLAYARLREEFQARFDNLEAEYETASADRRLELEANYEKIDLEQVQAQKRFIRDYPSSAISLSALEELDWSFESASGLREYLEILDSSLHSQKAYEDLDKLAGRMEQVEVGKVAPDFSMEDSEGQVRKLSDQYGASEYLFVDFWASHCGPCRLENRNIRKAYALYHDKGFDVLGISTDTRRENWLGAIAADSLGWTNLCSLKEWKENEVVQLFALRQTSQNFLLDRNGKIIATELRGEDLLTTLDRLFR